MRSLALFVSVMYSLWYAKRQSLRAVYPEFCYRSAAQSLTTGNRDYLHFKCNYIYGFLETLLFRKEIEESPLVYVV